MILRAAKSDLPILGILRFSILAGIAVAAVAQPPKRMPYSAVDHPEFVTPSKADFLSDGDVVVGVARGKAARAYPAADLDQHGVVIDQMPDGPIAVTW